MILIDTGPLVALCDPRDGRHRIAASDLRRLGRQPILTCDAVIVEACFHLPHAVQRARLQALIDQLDIAPAPGHGRVFQDEVFHWLAKYADHEPDWADGCLAVLSGRDRQLKVWTYDQEFQTTWRRPDRTAIPLAGTPWRRPRSLDT
jgi:predicted nucleic acid-binding protein